VRIAPNWRRFVHAFVSAICRLDCRGRFGVFVSALENCVSRRRRLALIETRFECWVSATESRASRAALTIRQASRLEVKNLPFHAPTDDLESAVARFAQEPGGGLIVLPTALNRRATDAQVLEDAERPDRRL
jgi:hypothetical protein